MAQLSPVTMSRRMVDDDRAGPLSPMSVSRQQIEEQRRQAKEEKQKRMMGISAVSDQSTMQVLEDESKRRSEIKQIMDRLYDTSRSMESRITLIENELQQKCSVSLLAEAKQELRNGLSSEFEQRRQELISDVKKESKRCHEESQKHIQGMFEKMQLLYTDISTELNKCGSLFKGHGQLSDEVKALATRVDDHISKLHSAMDKNMKETRAELKREETNRSMDKEEVLAQLAQECLNREKDEADILQGVEQIMKQMRVSHKAQYDDWGSEYAQYVPEETRPRPPKQEMMQNEVIRSCLNDSGACSSNSIRPGAIQSQDLLTVFELLAPGVWNAEKIEEVLVHAGVNQDREIKLAELLQWIFGDTAVGKMNNSTHDQFLQNVKASVESENNTSTANAADNAAPR